MAYAKAVAASLTNINVSSPGAAIDGVPLNNGDRVLLTRQTTASQNGVWVFDTDITAMSRPGAPDQYQNGVSFDNATIVWVTGGDTLAGTVWGIDPATRVTVGTTAHNLTRVSLPPVQCRAATTADINLASTHTSIDGVTLVGNGTAGSDIVLVTDGTDQQSSSHTEKSEAAQSESLRSSRPDVARVLRSVLRRQLPSSS